MARKRVPRACGRFDVRACTYLFCCTCIGWIAFSIHGRAQEGFQRLGSTVRIVFFECAGQLVKELRQAAVDFVRRFVAFLVRLLCTCTWVATARGLPAQRIELQTATLFHLLRRGRAFLGFPPLGILHEERVQRVCESRGAFPSATWSWRFHPSTTSSRRATRARPPPSQRCTYDRATGRDPHPRPSHERCLLLRPPSHVQRHAQAPPCRRRLARKSAASSSSPRARTDERRRRCAPKRRAVRPESRRRDCATSPVGRFTKLAARQKHQLVVVERKRRNTTAIRSDRSEAIYVRRVGPSMAMPKDTSDWTKQQ